MALSKQTVRMFPSPHLTLPHPAPLSLPGWWEASTIIVVAPELRCALHNKDQISITLPNILDIYSYLFALLQITPLQKL